MVDGSVSRSWLWILGLLPWVHAYDVLVPMLCGRRASPCVDRRAVIRLAAPCLVSSGAAGPVLADTCEALVVMAWLV